MRITVDKLNSTIGVRQAFNAEMVGHRWVRLDAPEGIYSSARREDPVYSTRPERSAGGLSVSGSVLRALPQPPQRFIACLSPLDG
jgi:hypothetical protein